MGRTAGNWAESRNSNVLVGGDFNVNPDRRVFVRLADDGFGLMAPSCGHTLVGDSRACLDHVYGYQRAMGPTSSAIITGMNRSDSDHFPVRVQVAYR